MTRKEAQRKLAAAIREQKAAQEEVREANARVVEATSKLPPHYIDKRFAEGERERIQKLIDRAQRASDRLGTSAADVVNLRSLVSTQQVQKTSPGRRHYATKKSPAQLKREIAEVLAQRPAGRAHATTKQRANPVECMVTASIRLSGAPAAMQTREFKHRADAQAWLDQQREIADRRGWSGYRFELTEQCEINKRR